MKVHTSEFKNAIKQLGREIKGVITYDNTTLNEEIKSITPHFEANLLKSVMKQLDLELSVDIPLETVINCQMGIFVNNNFEMLNFGNYVVFSSEKQEDTGNYKIVCYDKMLYAMKQNEDLEITYPITIANYLIALATKIGLTVANTTFYNSNLTIPSELYLGQEYTYRDILDEIAQATGSIIVINSNDEMEVKYPTFTNDTIDEEFLKDTNVVFKEKYGPINSIVLSRSGESDNVYLQDTESVQQNGLCEVKIVDNQIMNFNNRSDFLQGILNALDGIEYYKNNLSSFGVLYYEVGDFYNVLIGQNSYQCLMLNDEITMTTGIQETIYTEIPEQSETDYIKADKTDMKINKTYLIVDKQNQTIESVVSNVSEQNNKISQITQTVDELNSKIQDIADITTYGESDSAYVELEGINQSEPIMIKVHPTTTNISYLYPRNNLFPSDLQYLPDRIIRFVRTYTENEETLTENIDYELPDDLLTYDSNTYDEFYLDYDSQTCQVIKRCQYNADGTVSALANEITVDYPYPQILLGDGDYTIQLKGYDYGYLYVRLMAQNIYTTQFATRAELTSEINQSATNIMLSVSENYSNTNEMNAAINLAAGEINSTVSQKVGKDEVISSINQTSEAVTIDANKINLAGKTINMTTDNITIASNNFNVDKYGNMTCNSATITGGNVTLGDAGQSGGLITIYSSSENTTKTLLSSWGPTMYFKNKKLCYPTHIENANNPNYGGIGYYFEDTSGHKTIIEPTEIRTPVVYQTSKEEDKKNFEKLEQGIEIIKNIDIYKYNLQDEDDKDKKHIGFVIGKNYKYSKEVTSKDNDGVDVYSFVSVCCKAIQEQQEQIEQLKNQIETLKGGK